MRVVEKNEQFIVIDDALSAEKFEALGSFMQVESFRSVHADEWRKVWRLSDGTPMAGVPVYSKQPLPNQVQTDNYKVLPTRTSIDFVFTLLAELREELAALVGHHGTDWDMVSAKPFLYPPETGLSWHADATIYSGAFVLYAHPEWNCQWGGELLIASADTHDKPNWDGQVPIVEFADDGAIASVTEVPIGPHLRNTRENELLGDVGMGTYVAAKPNRLVVLAGGSQHKVVRVDRAAGQHVRWSVAGFFIRPESSD